MASQDPASETAQSQESPSKPQDSFRKNKRITGTVKWFNAKDGFGFITRHDTGEDVFVHRSAIAKPNRNQVAKSIGDGEIVEFGLIATKVTGPGFKAVKGSPFVAQRGGRRSRPGSRANQAPKKIVGQVDSVGDGAEEMERLTQMLSIQPNSNGVESENAGEHEHSDECGDAPSTESVSTNTSDDTEA